MKVDFTPKMIRADSGLGVGVEMKIYIILPFNSPGGDLCSPDGCRPVHYPASGLLVREDHLDFQAHFTPHFSFIGG